ncbi:MAG: PAC2 family protein [Candidatus Micrarchaeaceae archaeon]
MERTRIFFNKEAKLKEPILIVGLPGVGSVGALVGDKLRRELKSKLFATIYSPHFLPQVLISQSGKVRLVSNRLYCAEVNGRSILILVGDMQAGTPEGYYEVSERIIRFFKRLGGREAYAIGGYGIDNKVVKNPKVYGAANDGEMINKLKKYGVIFGEQRGPIWGSVGLIVAMAKWYGIKGACILGETGLLDVDANSAKKVLNVISKILGIEIDVSDLERISNETRNILKKLEERQKEDENFRPQENPSYIR